jgi:phage terminase Nu1 subunit (DNA packaging protein)
MTRDELERATVSVVELAELLDLSTRRIQQLAAAGVIPRLEHGKYRLLPALHGYFAFLQACMTREGSSSELTRQRARLARAQAERLEAQNAEMRRRFAPRWLIERVIEACGKKAAKALGEIVPAIRRRLPELSPTAQRIIEVEVESARDIARRMRLPDSTDIDGDGQGDSVDIADRPLP